MGYGNRSYGTTTYGDGIGGIYVAPPTIYPNTSKQDAVWQIDENIGFFLTASKDAVWQIDENVGLAPSSTTILFRLLRRRD